MDLSLFSEIVTIFGLSVGVICLCHRVRVPPIVGFLITGVIAGPYGLGLVSAVHEVEVMAEVGVVFLLFTIGLELSVGELVRMKRAVLLGGGAQVALTILAATAIGMGLGWAWRQAVMAGFLVSLSSTAIVLKLMQQRAEMDSAHGRVVLAVLILQDLVVVPMMLAVPFLASHGAGADGEGAHGLLLLWPVAKGAGIVLAVFFLARKAVPVLLDRIVRTRSRELFLIGTLAMCLATAYLTAQVGLSLSLGAFLAGLILSESEYSLSAMEGVLPFRDVFTSLFFISVGMLLDVRFLMNSLPLVAGATLAVLVLKTVAAGAAAHILGYPLRVAVLAGVALCQVGEFSFVLAREGVANGLLDQGAYQLFLAASILSMALTPPLMAMGPALADRVRGLPWLAKLKPRPFEREMARAGATHAGLTGHLVITGFGVGGRHLARAARGFGIPYRIVEMNPDTVRHSAAEGEPIVYGDASQRAVLGHVEIGRARVLAVMVPDPATARRITDAARRINPSLHIITRTRFLSELSPLLDLGANDVVPEEFETSVEIFTRVLARFLVPRRDIERFTDEVRAEGYGMLRASACGGEPLCVLSRRFPELDVSAVTVEEGSALAGRSLVEADLRRVHGLTVVAVARAGEVTANPDGDWRLAPGDVAYVFGRPDQVADGAELFAASGSGAD
jgi:CPA2 family monovalent cation:H+ antiporter-2